jgi:hypothetical protein
MKRLVNFIKTNKVSLIIALVVVVGFYLLGWYSSQNIWIDYSPVMDSLENKIEKDKQDLLDSVAIFDSRINSQKKDIEILSDKIRVQSTEITKIKKDYEIKRTNINNLDIDGTILESRKQLSK